MNLDANVTFALGPTNTGKTHRAIERMLEFDSGMIGLPLRLLAREVYDKLTARVGEESVALVTGEEKRVPRTAAYWVCTVEAMPLSRPVEFLAVDEIQLCAHRQRGHVFTDRLLHARGSKETWFLGSDTMRPMSIRLFPFARQRKFHRFSNLTYTGERSLRALAPRGCAVAFSASQVYVLAERLRALRGGVAVVIGALSPRTRNAQVAMYQSGEVSHLVATDAIGMGLNLDIDHVAFAGLRKFDGREHRGLTPAELAQIAGRAGRHLNDGTFGTLRGDGDGPMDGRVVLAIEAHRFRPVERLVWRNPEPSFSSLEELVRTLAAHPTDRAMKRVERADDFEALSVLSRDSEVVTAVAREDSLRLLWDTCQIPDFRKLMLQQHAELVKTVFLQRLGSGGAVDDDWFEGKIRSVRSLAGGLDALTARLAAVRVLTYISHQSGWVSDPSQYREKTRAIEDALGDALHERLIERFVSAPETRRVRHRVPKASGPTDGPFAKLKELRVGAENGVSGPGTVEEFVERIAEAHHDAFSLQSNGLVWFEGETFARLVRGRLRTEPTVALHNPGEFRAGERRRIEQRLRAFCQDVVLQAQGGIRMATWKPELNDEAQAVRALSYQLNDSLCVLPLKQARASLSVLSDETKRSLREKGIRPGNRFLFAQGAMTPRAMEIRATLTSMFEGGRRPRGVPTESWVPIKRFQDGKTALRYGYERQGPVAIRIDLLEAVYTEGHDSEAMPTLEALGLSERRKKTLARIVLRHHARG